MKYWLIVLSIIIFSQCTYNKTDIVEYEGYGDDEKTKLALKGNLVNGKEDGEWDFYDSTGAIEKKGSFQNGLKFGKWIYLKDNIKEEIDWQISNDIQGVNFSYPASFKKIFNKVDTSSIYYYDSLKSQVISIRIFKGPLGFKIDSFFSMNLNDFYTTSFVNNAQSDLIIKDKYTYYIDEFNVVEKKSGIEHTVYTFYELIEGNLITMTISGHSNRKSSSFNIINEIFANFWVSDKRVLGPF